MYRLAEVERKVGAASTPGAIGPTPVRTYLVSSRSRSSSRTIATVSRSQ